MEFSLIGKPGNLDGIEEEVFSNYKKVYGSNNWNLSEGKLYVKRSVEPLEQADIYFITGNQGKVFSAQRSLGSQNKIAKMGLKIDENLRTIDAIAIKKARIGYAVLCRPVIADDSGFLIPSIGGWPGSRVDRELKDKGIDYFTNLAKKGPINAYFSMALTYLDENLKHWPVKFVSDVKGSLINEIRGDLSQSFVKSPLAGCFIIEGQTRTIAEMTESEYKNHATDRWEKLKSFLEDK
jgi:non-canonical purine NTP pyrophosphatase (RdgB/HAM1 family)